MISQNTEKQQIKTKHIKRDSISIHRDKRVIFMMHSLCFNGISLSLTTKPRIILKLLKKHLRKYKKPKEYEVQL
jgi:hypothetical protein